MLPIVMAMTGASGSLYAVRLLQTLLLAGRDVHLTVSHAAQLVLRQELQLAIDPKNFDVGQLLPLKTPTDETHPLARLGSPDLSLKESANVGRVTFHDVRDYRAGIASGSFLTAGMVICPCSMGTLAAISHGHSENLVHRAADVHLKERRKLIVVPRETPLSSIALENMHRLSQAGAIVLPAMPGFYHGAASVMDLVDFVVARICDQLQVQHTLMPRWGETEPAW